MTKTKRAPAAAIVALASATALAGCTSHALPSRNDGIVDVVASTALIADVAQNIAGDRARVSSLMPSNADPHTYEPTLRNIRTVANADVAFTNDLLLEQQSLLGSISNNVRPGVPVVALAEHAPEHGGTLIPLVEDLSLDTVWLGMRVLGKGQELGASGSSQVVMTATAVDGPGDAAAFLTGTFGNPEIFFNSGDGLDPAGIGGADSTALPVDAHTHISWAFSEPGIYTVDFAARLLPNPNDFASGVDVGSAQFTFAVGVDPHSVPGKENATVLDKGHEDISVDLRNKQLIIHGDSLLHAGDEIGSQDIATEFDPADTVISVPTSALQQIPPRPEYRFLGRPGHEVYMLRQAVLGKHVHGDIDPHVWHDVANVKAFVKQIQQTLSEVDPQGAAVYAANAQAYNTQLDQVDAYVRQRVESIDPSRRYLVTTHDAYGYLGRAYGMKIAGFVTPNPAIEPSSRDLVALTRTLQNLHVPAVFLEPNFSSRAKDLTQTAQRLGVNVCRIYGDAFDDSVDTYLEMMRFNADALVQCLSPAAGPPPGANNSDANTTDPTSETEKDTDNS